MGNLPGLPIGCLGTGDTEMGILMVGLDACGKTTTLYKLKLDEIVTTIPTIGFNIETISYNGISTIFEYTTK